MRTNKKFTGCIIFLFMYASLVAQNNNQPSENQEFKPVYITMTTTHWNPDPEVDYTNWLDTEKEYFEKVTSKNNLIINSGVYTHYFTPDNSEIVLVSVYENWDDIEKANEVNSKLIEEGWPDEKARDTFFKRQSSYYAADHSDEIYSSLPYYKPLTVKSDKPLIYYVRKSDMALNGQGSPEKFKEFNNKVTQKNSKLKAYYSHRHLWGSNSREFSEVFVFEKLADIEDFFNENEELTASAWPDEKLRGDFMKEMGKSFTGKHADYVYRSVPELMKQ